MPADAVLSTKLRAVVKRVECLEVVTAHLYSPVIATVAIEFVRFARLNTAGPGTVKSHRCLSPCGEWIQKIPSIEIVRIREADVANWPERPLSHLWPSMKCVYCLEKELDTAICDLLSSRINLLRLAPVQWGLYLRTHGYRLKTPADKAAESLGAS